MTASSSGGPGWVKKPPRPGQKPLDSTSLAGDRYGAEDAASDQASASTLMPRVGLRRCAMMYRLLSQVPQEALARELAECGVDAASVEDLDQEGLIEAIIQQLS